MSAQTANIPILVVDDERGIRDLLVYELGSRGYRVVPAGDAAEALRLFREGDFPIVLSDVRMPGIDGARLLEEIKALRPATEVILLTGYGTLESAVAAMKRGAYDYLQKPFDVEELAGLIARALEKRELTALVALHEASRAVFRTLELERLLPELLDLALKVLQADGAALFALDEGGTPALLSTRGEPGSVAAASGAARRLAAEKGRPLGTLCLPSQPAADPRLKDLEGFSAARGLFFAPLCAGGRSVGLLCAVRMRADAPTGFLDLRHADIFCSQLAQALENAMAYRRLRQAQEQLVRSEKLGAAGLLAASVAHDLNSPLTGILGITQVLQEQPGLSPGLRADLEIIAEQSHRCTLLVRGLLGFCRSDSARLEDVPVLKGLEAVLRLLRRELSEAGIELVRDFPEEGPHVRADPLQLQQVFLNLAVNAIHAMRERPRRRLEVGVTQAGGEVRVVFRDSGHGIPEDKLRAVFEPFYTTKTEGEGTGLGLYICERILAQHGGGIGVESRAGEGTTFTVRLPAGGGA
ncbi:MAG: ATP-binding protein [Elusimicrobiota bacterium]|jgi:signal transduction histidine kinase